METVFTPQSQIWRRVSWPLFVAVLGGALLVVGLIRTAWLGDDALIIFRSVLNWLHGYGPNFNINERVQTFTCPLWFLLISAATAITGEPFVTTLILSILVSLIAVTVMVVSAWRFRGWGLTLALIGLALSRTYVEFATSGLETPLACLLIALTVVAIEKQKPEDLTGFARTIFFIALSLANRLDLLFLLAPIALLAVWRCRRPVPVIIGGAIGMLPVLAWYGFALCYYGSILPNTFYAKLGGGIPEVDLVRQGVRYVVHSFATDPVGIGLIFASFAVALREPRAEQRALMIGILVYLGYVIWVGGDFMVWRFVAAPVFAAAMLLSRSRIRLPNAYGLSAVATLFLLSLYFGAPFLSPADYGPAQQTGTQGIVIERAWYFPPYGLLSPTRKFPDVAAWSKSAPCNRQEAPPIRVEYRIGIAGLDSGPCTHIIDVVGLADPLLARLPAIDVPNLRIGHLFRNMPAHYQESVAADDNQLADPAMRYLYAAVRLATRGPLWTTERWKAIWQLTTGQLNRPSAFVSFRTPPFATQPLNPTARAAPYGPLRDGIDAEFYRQANYDVSMLGLDPIEHYRTNGWHEGRWPNTLFDPQYYLDHYGKQIPAGMEPLQHYLTTGWRLGFRPSELFDPQAYLAHNPDVAAANVNPMLHYLDTGFREGRTW